MKRLFCFSIILFFTAFNANAQELFNISDKAFLNYLEDRHPELIFKDSLDVDSAALIEGPFSFTQNHSI